MKLFNLMSSLLIVLTGIQFTFSMHWASDTQLRDLEYNGVEFVGEASHWYCSSLKKPNNNTYDCNGVYYLGGFDIMGLNSNNYFQRTYYSLPTHNQVKISFTQFAMDNCDNPDRMDISIDGNLISGFIMDTSVTMAAYASPICGAAGNDYPPFTATFTYPHSSTTSITIQMIMNLNNNVRDESIAFRDLVIDFQTVTSPVSSMCAISSKPLFTSTYACACPLTNQYQNPANSGQCSFCDSTCATCSGSAATQCTSCYPYTDRYYSSNQCLSCYTGCATCTGGGQYQCTSCKTGYYLANNGACYTTCDFPLYTLGDTTSPLLPNKCLSPCTSASAPYLYWDGTCSSTCASPLSSSSTNSYTTCTYPCTEFQYLYWNGSCLSTCPYPLTTRVQNYRYFCDFPCSDTSQYLLWDASCSTSCASALIPLVQVTEASRKYCRFQCSPSQYLYWNGSCLNTCPYPLTTRITNSRYFCDFPCSTTTNYLYWNGSCLTSCNSPLSPRTEGTSLIRYYCDYPCGVSTDYLYWNGTCSTCLSPLLTRIDADNNFCDYPCATTEWLYWDGTCQTACASPLVQDIQGTSTTRKFCQYYCGIDQYMYWNGSCIDTCEFPLSYRYANSRKFCDFPCTSPSTEYLYWNGSCISSCATPLSPRLEGTPTRMFCDYPCTSSSDYLYWNTTCGSCDAPLIKRVDAKNNFCDYPCQPSEWLYWDSSCNTTCPSPALTQVAEGTPSRNYCTYQCGVDQYLYWNGTCADSCDTPLVSGTNNGRNFCYYPCLTTEYVYPNGTCTSSCSSLFTPKTEAGRNYCQYPCLATQVLLYDGTCLPSCDPPYVLNVYSYQNFCDLPCPSNYYWVTDQEFCNATCYTPVYFIDTKKPYLRCIPSPIILEKGNLIEAPTKPETLTLLTLFRPMNYMRYLEISMPERLDRLAASRGRNVLATYFGLQIKSSANLSFYREELPYVYTRHNVQSSFLVNYWQDLITLLIGIAAALFFFVLEKVSFSEGWELIELISRRIRVILMWNYVLMVFAWNIDDLILFVAVEYMTLSKQPEAPASTPVSFLLSLFFLCLMLGFIYGAAQLIQRRRHLLRIDPHFKKSEYAKNFDLKYENYQVLYRGFKDNSISNQFFFLIYMFRIALPMIIAVSAIKSPKTVSIFALTINFFMLLYLFIMRPFKKLINQIQLVFYEIVIFMMNVCVLILTLKSPSKTQSAGIIRLGDAIIIGNDIINILILVFLVIKIYIEATALYKDMKRLKRISTKEKVTTYLQLLALPIQQDNMGFEEMINYYCPPPKPWFEPLVKRLFGVVVAWFNSSWNGMTSDCRDCFSSSSSKKKAFNRTSEFGEFEGESVEQSTIGGNSSRKNTKGGDTNHNNKNGSKNVHESVGRSRKGKITNWGFFFSNNNGGEYDDEEGGKSKDDLSQLDGLHTYDALDKLNRVHDKSKAQNDDVSNGEIRLINQDISINAGSDRGNHLDHFVHDDFNGGSRQYNVKYAKNKVVPLSPQPSDMSAIGGRPVLDNTDLNLEPFMLPSQASPQDQNILVISNNNSMTNLNMRKKRGRINNFDLKLDSSDLQGDSQNPGSGIPDTLSPISKFLESNQTTPVNPDSDLSKTDGKSQAVLVKKDYDGYEWNKNNQSPAAFDLDDSFDKNKKKVIKRKKRVQANFKLSDLAPDEAEDGDEDYMGWKPYKGK